MANSPRFVSAASLSLQSFADVFTSSYEGYAYPVTATARDVAARVRTEQIDLFRSLVMLVEDKPVGQATLGLRGARAWCGGFGVFAPWRGRGLAGQLLAALLEQAREAGAHRLGLEVLAQNKPALATYRKAGLQATRDLLVLGWQAQQPAPSPDEAALAPIELREVAALFAALHPVPAAWQRDLPALLTRANLQGLALRDGAAVAAYALFSKSADGGIWLADLGAQNAERAAALLEALKAQTTRIVSVNEPADNPLLAAFFGAGFVERDRQHEMSLELAAANH